MRLSDQIACALSDDDTRCHRVSGGDTRHDRGICDTKTFNPVDLELVIDHGHAVASHFGRAGLVPVSDGRLSDEIDHPCPVSRARHCFARDQRREGVAISEFATQLNRCQGCSHVFRLTERVWFNQDRVVCIGAGEPQPATAFRLRKP